MLKELLNDPVGSYPAATVACFDPVTGDLPRRQLDDDRCVAFLNALATAGAEAVLIAASTGHGHLRTVAELEHWLAVAARADDKLVRMALLRPEDGAEANERLTKLCADLGYGVIFVRPGTDLAAGATQEQIAANMRPVVAASAAAGLATGLYSIPDVSGVPLPPGAAELLLKGEGGENIVAIKVTEASYEESTLRFLKTPSLSQLKIVQGWDPHIASALRDGRTHAADSRQRCGVTSGPMSFAVHQYLHIFAAAERGDWEEVSTAQAAVTSLFASMQDDPAKFADLQRAKWMMGLGHPLTGTVLGEQTSRVLQALHDLPRKQDRQRLAASLDLMADGPFHTELAHVSS